MLPILTTRDAPELRSGRDESLNRAGRRRVWFSKQAINQLCDGVGAGESAASKQWFAMRSGVRTARDLEMLLRLEKAYDVTLQGNLANGEASEVREWAWSGWECVQRFLFALR